MQRPIRRCTPSSLGFLEPDQLARLDCQGKLLSGDPPSKELPLHLAVYHARPDAGGVVHLHSTYATVLSCLAETNPDDAIPPITPYVVMRVGRVPVLPYFQPGTSDIVPLVQACAADHAAFLLANHGPVVLGQTLEAAVVAAEELEETAKLVFLTHGRSLRAIPRKSIEELRMRFR